MRKVSRSEYFFPDRKAIEGIDGLEARLAAIEADEGYNTVTNVTTATYTVLATDEVIIANRGAGVAITLPAISASIIGRTYVIKNVGAGAAVVTPTGTDTIDGGASLSVAQYGAIKVCITAAGVWRTINADTPAVVAAAIVAADIPGEVTDAITAADIPGAVDDYLGAEPALLLAAMNGDIVMAIAPATTYVTAAAAADGFSEAVTVTFKTAAGDTHSWLSGAIGVTVSDDGAGTATLSSATPAIVAGVATFNVIGDTAAWLAGQKATAVVANKTLLGYTVTGGNAVVEISA